MRGGAASDVITTAPAHHGPVKACINVVTIVTTIVGPLTQRPIGAKTYTENSKHIGIISRIFILKNFS